MNNESRRAFGDVMFYIALSALIPLSFLAIGALGSGNLSDANLSELRPIIFAFATFVYTEFSVIYRKLGFATSFLLGFFQTLLLRVVYLKVMMAMAVSPWMTSFLVSSMVTISCGLLLMGAIDLLLKNRKPSKQGYINSK